VPSAERPRRVAIVYDCLFPLDAGGGERVYRRIAELLAARGVEVDYLTRDQPGADALAAPFRVVPVARVELYDDAGTRTLGGALGFARGVRRELRRTRGDYDLVLASALPVLTLLAARAGLGRGTALVGDWLEVWGARTWRAYSGALAGTAAWVLQWIGAHATRLHTVNSGFTAARLRGLRRGLRPIVLGLVDLADRPPVREPRAEPPVVLFAGRHIPDKRVALIPDVVAAVRRDLPDVVAAIVGDGPERAAVEARVRELGLDGVVEIAGRVDDDDLDRRFARAAVMLNPSAREGFGLVVAEAAARGVPAVVVAGPDNAAVELIEPGVNGAVAPSADPEAIAAAVVEAVRGGDALRRSTATWFDAARVERGLAASVDELLARYAAARRRD
jgi:glycosyltransferase involved in cell wall biosynthesis